MMFRLLLTLLALGMTVLSDDTASCQCGLSFQHQVDKRSTTIYKGSVAPPNKYPWMAYIVIDNGDVHCSATILDTHTLMTAAHCVHDWRDGNEYPASSVKVYVGHNNRTALHEAELYQVDRIIIDSRYSFKYPIRQDFALLKVSHAFAFSDKVSPICIPEETTTDYKVLQLAGWGISGPTTDKQINPSDMLKEAELDYVPPDECMDMKEKWYDVADKRYGVNLRPHAVSDLHMCAINRKTGAGPCPGDSGGALMHQDASGRYFQVGVVSGSWGQCDQRLAVPLFTRTQRYHTMLKSNSEACFLKMHT